MIRLLCFAHQLLGARSRAPGRAPPFSRSGPEGAASLSPLFCSFPSISRDPPGEGASAAIVSRGRCPREEPVAVDVAAVANRYKNIPAHCARLTVAAGPFTRPLPLIGPLFSRNFYSPGPREICLSPRRTGITSSCRRASSIPKMTSRRQKRPQVGAGKPGEEEAAVIAGQLPRPRRDRSLPAAG